MWQPWRGNFAEARREIKDFADRCGIIERNYDELDAIIGFWRTVIEDGRAPCTYAAETAAERRHYRKVPRAASRSVR